jgi:hypothetical protein
VQWGDRLFYPGNRIVRPGADPRLRLRHPADRAAAIRARIEATVLRRAPQVMVKVTGGGRGMRSIAAHFRYISKNGRLEIEDERGQASQGKKALRDLVDDWRLGGSFIDEVSGRREAFNILLSMPRGSADALVVQRAAREFAQAELTDHKYVMVLHDHQANPHVHLSVRAESMHGQRLNPRKADLQRWRETFAEKLCEQGIDCEATRQPTRGAWRNYDPIWRVKAREAGRLRLPRPERKASPAATATRRQAGEAWAQIARALASSGNETDRQLGRAVEHYLSGRAASHQRTTPQVPVREAARQVPFDRTR